MPLTFRYQPSQYLTSIKDKTVKKLQLFSVTSLNRCVVPITPQKLDGSLGDAHSKARTEQGTHLLRSGQKTTGNNKSPGDQPGQIRCRHSPKQINTIQGAAEKQDGFVPLCKHWSCLCARPKAMGACVFHSVFASDLNPDLQGHPLWG